METLVLIEPYQALPLQVRVELKVKGTKEYAIFSKDTTLPLPHHQIVQCHIQDIH